MARSPARLLIALLAASALVPASAQAVDRVVDDDKVQCPGAAFTDVQSAVDAAQYGDVVRVCRGTYAGQVVVPAEKANLKLVSAPAGAATLTAPPGGIEFTGEHPLAIVAIYGRGIYVSGFVIDGPLGELDEFACNSHLHAGGIAVLAGRTTIDGVRIQGIRADCSEFFGPDAVFGAGVHVGDVDGSFTPFQPPPSGDVEDGVVIDRSIIRDAHDGVLKEGGAGTTTVQRSVLEGPSDPDGPFTSAGITVFDAEGGSASDLLLKVQSNEVSGWHVGVWDRFNVEGLVIVNGNRVDNSVFGIEIDSGFNRVQRNRVTRGDFGIVIGGSGNDSAFVYGDVRENVVRDAAVHGIAVFNRAACPEPACLSLLRDNSALRSGQFDCLDLQDAGRWTRNTGVTALPGEICRAPQGTVSTLRRGARRIAATADRHRRSGRNAHRHDLTHGP